MIREANQDLEEPTLQAYWGESYEVGADLMMHVPKLERMSGPLLPFRRQLCVTIEAVAVNGGDTCPDRSAFVQVKDLEHYKSIAHPCDAFWLRLNVFQRRAVYTVQNAPETGWYVRFEEE